MKFLRRLLGRQEELGVSITKLGVLVMGVARAVMEVTPAHIDKYLTIVVIIGGIMAGNGVRDAITKKNNK